MDIGIVRHELSERAFDLGWFPERLSDEDANAIRDLRLRGLEIRVDGIDRDDDRFEEARSAVESVLKKGFESGCGYVFLAEHRPEAPSRIRSHKGVFSRSGRLSASRVQFEFTVDRGSTVIGEVSPISAQSAEEACQAMRDSLRSCAFLISEDCKPETLLSETMKCLDIKGSVLIDYMKLIPCASRLGAAVVVRGGDHESFESIRVFAYEEACKAAERVVAQISTNPLSRTAK